MVKLSIAIPTYERQEFLVQTLQNIKQQLVEDVEVVVSDNGSKDGTKQILKSFKMPLTVTGFEENQGIDANIINVIQAAQGEYIFLFSDDDLFTEGLLSALFLIIEKNYDVIALNHYAFTHDPTTPLTPCFLPKIDKEFSQGEKFFRFAGLGFLSSLVFKKHLALPFLSKVRLGKECAHVDIVSRIALAQASRCFFAGKIIVAARALAIPRYSMMNSCVIFLNELYCELFHEKKISHFSYVYFQNRLVFKEIPRIYYKLLLQEPSTSKIALQEVAQEFKENILYKFFLNSLLIMPNRFAKLIFNIIYNLLLIKRKIMK